jgi:hypothetical protein
VGLRNVRFVNVDRIMINGEILAAIRNLALST